METIISRSSKHNAKILIKNNVAEPTYFKENKLSSFEKKFVWLAIRARIFFIACYTLRSPKKIITVYKKLIQLREQTWSGNMKKMYKVNGKYIFNLYTPGWPSKAYDDIIKNELHSYSSPLNNIEKLRFIFLAVTRKCPLRCEH